MSVQRNSTQTNKFDKMMKTDNCISDWVTTGEAAVLCGVTPDTILKWIKKGKLPVTRTAGGHHRIGRSALRPYLAIIERAETGTRGNHNPIVCWQFHAKKNGIRSKCRKCPVYLQNTGTNAIDYQI